MKEYKVYKITCLINNKIYIGQTYETLTQRFKRHIQCAKSNIDTKFYRAIRKYGEQNFKIELLEKCNNPIDLNEREFYWINKLDAVNNGYNTKNSIGKCGGDTLTNHPNIKLISKKLSMSKSGTSNPNHRAIKAKNIITLEELHFSYMKQAQEYFKMTRHDIISRRCRNIIKIPWNNWIFAYEENEYIDFSNKNVITIIDTIKQEKKDFIRYSEAERYYNFPVRAISKKINRGNLHT